MVPYYSQIKVKLCSSKPSKTRLQSSPPATLPTTPLHKLVCSELPNLPALNFQTYIELTYPLVCLCSYHSPALKFLSAI